MKFLQVFAFVLLLALCGGDVQAETYGSKRFACMEMFWSIPTGSASVNVAFAIKNEEPFARLTLNPQERFRQFNFSTDAILAEGRMRLHIDQARNKGILNLDSFSYRCYTPAEQVFSGSLVEFDLPSGP
ncbi:MAG: hypothetical protein R2864_02220 [Syntrophotaleaceae bacterium]